MHPRLLQQLRAARSAGGSEQEHLERLLPLVDATYRDMADDPGLPMAEVLDLIGDAVLYVDEEGRVAAANRAAATIFGTAADEIHGLSVTELLDSVPGRPAGSWLWDLPDGEVRETRGFRRGGETFPVEVARTSSAGGKAVLVIRDLSGASSAAQALADSERRYRDLFENVVDGVYETTADGRFVSVNPALVAMLGYESADELKAIGSTEQLYMDPSERPRAAEATNGQGELRNAELRLKRKDGREIIVLENAREVRDEAGTLVGYQGTLSDITDMRRAERAILATQARALVTLRSIADAVVTTDADGAVAYMNPVAEQLTGWSLADARGRPVDEVTRFAHEVNGRPLPNPAEQGLAGDDLAKSDRQAVLVGQGGDRVPVQESVAPIHGPDGELQGVVMVLHDVSSERRLRNQLAYQASHDALTGLVNRREFDRRVAQAVEHCRPAGGHALLYLDLDQFKAVNDACGHGAGDELLRQVTELIRGRVRGGDTVARLGGDEFGVLLHNCGVAKAIKLADMLRQSIRAHRFAWGGRVFDLGVSIGVVRVGPESGGLEIVLAAADRACYAAKEAGRNRIHVYEPGEEGLRDREVSAVEQLTEAMENERLQLYFQPIVPLGGLRPEGGNFELLLRLRSPTGELIPPAAFMPAAERYKLMPRLDQWVVERALGELTADCGSAGRAGYTVSVNLAGSSLSDTGFLEFLMDALERSAPAAGALCFEISETDAVSHVERTRAFIQDVRRLGCEIALDDFGGGLSSFAYLRDLPVDYVKIDGQFTRNICSDALDHSMVDAIRSVGGALGISTVAEQVDSAEALAALTRIGVHFAQGFHIAAPAPVAAFPRLHRRGCPPRLHLA